MWDKCVCVFMCTEKETEIEGGMVENKKRARMFPYALEHILHL